MKVSIMPTILWEIFPQNIETKIGLTGNPTKSWIIADINVAEVCVDIVKGAIDFGNYFHFFLSDIHFR